MVKKYNPLETTSLTKSPITSSNIPPVIHLEDPAELVLNNFKTTDPKTISSDEVIGNAEELLKASASHLLLVVDESLEVIGVLRSKDIFGGKTYTAMEANRVKREKIKVKTVMVPIEDVITINIDDLKHAKVGHITETFRDKEKAYALVFEGSAEQPRIRGAFSLSQIAKMMGESNYGGEATPGSIAELQRKLD